jgi:hypothetical protein
MLRVGASALAAAEPCFPQVLDSCDLIGLEWEPRDQLFTNEHQG